MQPVGRWVPVTLGLLLAVPAGAEKGAKPGAKQEGAKQAGAQKEKRADVSGFYFLHGTKNTRLRLPGLTALMQLTDEQKEKLVRARDETVGSEAVRAAARKAKTDPNVSDADRLAARKASEDAQAQLDRRVEEILTAEQKALLQRIQSLHDQSVEEIRLAYEQKLIDAKGNQAETGKLRDEMRTALTMELGRRIRQSLSPEQQAAFERAASEELRREAAARQQKKGS